MGRLTVWLIVLLLGVTVIGPRVEPLTTSGTGVLQGVRHLLSCDANSIGQVTTHPSGASADPGCAAQLIGALRGSPTARFVQSVRSAPMRLGLP